MTKCLQNHTDLWLRPLQAEIAHSSLLDRLIRASDANLLVLPAPSGYGKTTLLGQLARASEYAARLSLGEGHTELASDDIGA